jgi:hypothetical protein
MIKRKEWGVSSSIAIVLTSVFAITLVPRVLANSQTAPPEILKVDPASWWIKSSMNPVRLMIHGRNLKAHKFRLADPEFKSLADQL